VCIKASSKGLYLASAARLDGLGRATPPNVREWKNVELWAPCFEVEVAGTTGAGDATIAGLLMAWLRGMLPTQAARAAAAVGASCCERPDAVTGVRPWIETEKRIQCGWTTAPIELDPDWILEGGVYQHHQRHHVQGEGG